MRHHDRNKKLSRKRKVRRGLIKSLYVSLISYGKIRTTLAKAKAMRPFMDRLVTYAKVGTVAKQRLLLKYLPRKAVSRLIKEWAPRYKERNGGYARIVKVGRRKSDGAHMAIVEFV